MFSSQPSIHRTSTDRALTTILREVISLHLMQVFQWNLTQSHHAVQIIENVLNVRGQRSRSWL